MGQAAIPILIAATVASGAIAAKSSIDAGKAAKAEAEAQSRREGDAARSREIERRRDLLRALASQTAESAAFGNETPLSVFETDIGYAQDDIIADRANVRAVQASLKARGKNAERAGKLGAVQSVFDTASSVASLYKPSGSAKAPGIT